ncbi:MAG: AMP-binding protein [Simkaniaceae bacterium]
MVSFLSRVLFNLLKLRYRFHIKNKEIFKDPAIKEGGVIFLPNHPAEIDPIMMMALLTPPFKVRPLVVDHFFFMSGARIFMNLVKAISIPNFETAANKWKERRGEKAFEEVAQGIKRKENFLIYPSGHLRRSPKERIGGSSFVYNLLNHTPEAKVVLIRMEGLWGSMFSRALTGSSPDFWKMVFKGVKIILKNGIFFVPKRDVYIELAFPLKDQLPIGEEKLTLNRYLEAFYNNYQGKSEEEIKLVSFSRSKEEFPKIEEPEKKQRMEDVEIPIEIRQFVLTKLAEVSKREREALKDEQDLSNDLGLDSLDIAGMLAFLDHNYEIEINHPGDLVTVEDLLHVAMGAKLSDEEEEEVLAIKWPIEPNRLEVTLPMGGTIHESLLRICERMGSSVACADNRLGVMTYKELKKRALVLSEHIRKLPGDRIGVLIPASSATYLLIFAILLSKKVPVMMNWTSGPRSLNHGADLTELKSIISSRKFLENADGIDLGDLDKRLILLEEIKCDLTLVSKLKGVFKSLLSPDLILKLTQLNKVSKDAPCVMLFTSGTENYPKCVPLSHYNILSDLRAALSCIDANREDILLGTLPPFHSFGFSVTGLMPLMAGFRTFFSPDPTDSKALAKAIANWEITMTCLAPSFYKNLFAVADPDDFKTVRYFVTGAEKAPRELYEYVENLGPNHQVIEGYGITECSPAVTISRPGKPVKGVGQPLPGIELKTIHPEEGTPLNEGESGEVIIKGPNVFEGYFGPDAPNPFIEIEGEKWYRSGDRGYLDSENNLIFEGRLKRFVKIGGEMISLTAVEDELKKAVKKLGIYQDEKMSLALSVIEKDQGRPDLILVTIFPILRDEVNQILKEAGFARIVKVSEVTMIDEIPLTGTGKIHFKALNDIAKKVNYA